MKISKELLSEVLVGLELDYEYPIEFYSNKNAFRYWIMESPKYQSTSEYINIYELAFKCKEWAFTNYKVLINSRTTSKTEDITGYAECIKSCDYLYGSYAGTEVEAIILASEWILKEINEKQLQH